MSKLALTTVLLFMSIECAFAQRTVPPRWNYQGQAVCPDNYDYVQQFNRCVARSFEGYSRGYGRRGYGPPVAPRWNSLGSVVCPDGYDYYASRGACFSR